MLLWWLFDPARLSAAVHGLLVDPTSEIWVSAASIWELSLKHHRGKLPELAGAICDLPSLLQADGFKGLPISQARGLRAGAYSQSHSDPFDRVLAAQAELERLVLFTADSQLTTFSCLVACKGPLQAQPQQPSLGSSRPSQRSGVQHRPGTR